ncbi:MAG: hypothetical protein ACRD5M_12460 [Candidatus Acidiferrales bacterium]
MRDKNYSTGLRGVLFEARHYQRMGAALWLYGWLVLRQTHQSDSVGWVLGGAPISYREIEEETGFLRKTIERWMKTLRAHGYIKTEPTQRGMIISIMKAKKFAQPHLKFKAGLLKSPGSAPQSCGRSAMKAISNQTHADWIGSSSVAGLKDKDLLAAICTEVRRQLQNGSVKPSGSSETENQPTAPLQTWLQNQPRKSFYDLRERQRRFRAERDEEVRRELAVGTGPEVPRK